MTAAMGAVCGVAITLGLLLAVTGLLPAPVTDPGRASWWQAAATRWRARPAPPRQQAWARWRWPVAVGGALVAWALSGWPVTGLITAAVVIGVPALAAASRAGARQIDRAEAVEEWTRRLADVLVTGTGLEQAVAATSRTCPAVIRPQVGDLSARLSARWPTDAALRAFADDLDDATGDLVTAALLLAARRRGPGLAPVLTAIADALAEEVAMLRTIDAERATPRTTARTITVITVGALLLAAGNTTYLRPYGTPGGQLVLAVLLSTFTATLAWVHALGRPRPVPRVLGHAPDPHPPTP
jgi:tight adherence protein B